MSVDMGLAWGNLFKDLTDAQMYKEELRLALLAEELGFGAVWSVEHHFDSYAMCPSNFQVLSWLAARTKTIKLGLGAVILPWHDPLRVIENVSMLDIMSDGRVLLGFGRGLAKMEYEGFRQDMAESRERFNEASRFVLQSLETGVAEYAGKYYRQPRVEIRPKPPRSFKGRVYGVAQSPDSVHPVAELGATLMSFVQGPIETHLPAIQTYRDVYKQKFGAYPEPVLLTDFAYCGESSDDAHEMAHQHIGAYFVSVMQHYDLMGRGFDNLKGYEHYEHRASALRELGKEEVLNKFINAQCWGTPEQIIAKIEARFRATGGCRQAFAFSYGAMPYDKAEKSMRRMSKKVLPEVASLERQYSN
jgi:alkanesulfonate monooxygenase SsuD/methylene tetrahydromethanopterin reductase-like flavin-dependent oxidoreductase (luciferase family)